MEERTYINISNIPGIPFWKPSHICMKRDTCFCLSTVKQDELYTICACDMYIQIRTYHMYTQMRCIMVYLYHMNRRANYTVWNENIYIHIYNAYELCIICIWYIYPSLYICVDLTIFTYAYIYAHLYMYIYIQRSANTTPELNSPDGTFDQTTPTSGKTCVWLHRIYGLEVWGNVSNEDKTLLFRVYQGLYSPAMWGLWIINHKS